MRSGTSIRLSRSSELISLSDWLFAGAFIGAACLIALLAWAGGSDGTWAVFRHNGEVVEKVPLSADEQVRIEGDYTTVFEVSGGGVRVIYTDCPNHQCEHTGEIRLAGQSVVCVPNEASAAIEGGTVHADAFTG